jgi:hypothetical protein
MAMSRRNRSLARSRSGKNPIDLDVKQRLFINIKINQFQKSSFFLGKGMRQMSVEIVLMSL